MDSTQSGFNAKVYLVFTAKWNFLLLPVITARVHTYDGRLCFHRCVSVQLSGGYPVPSLGGGVPHLRSGQGGTPSQVGGYPISGLVLVPHPRSCWGVGGLRVPHARSGWGVPHPRSG